MQSAINSAGLIKLDQILYFSSFEWSFLRRKMMEKSLRATVTVSTGMDGGSEGARVRWWMSLHPARAVGVGHGQEKRGQPPARPGTVAEFLNRPLSGQKTWSVVRDFPPSGVGERVCEGQRFSDGQRGREIPCANRDFYGRILFPFFLPLPFCCSSRTAGGSSSPLWGKNLKNKFRISTNLRSTRYWTKIPLPPFCCTKCRRTTSPRRKFKKFRKGISSKLIS